MIVSLKKKGYLVNILLINKNEKLLLSLLNFLLFLSRDFSALCRLYKEITNDYIFKPCDFSLLEAKPGKCDPFYLYC